MTFDAAYKTLNPEQKKAVDTVEGPVLVIAGPGTGKTHILTLRVANILKETQATPGSILVLTFTESAARTVRKRLIPLIGEDAAYKVAVHTFHSFAGDILGEYREHFADWSGKRLAGDVETTLLWREVLENEEIEHLRTAKSPFHYLRDLSMLRDELTRERVTMDAYRSWLDAQAKEIESDESLRYVRGEKAGELKPEAHKKLERVEKGREAAKLIEAYENLKDERGIYDFTDVLRIVVDGLSADDDLKAALQERYQYILADEHQDANALQHGLLDAFALDDHPNLFVVGDEKQAVFGFQGADSTHFRTFLELYPRTTVVELRSNFRSYQGILDLAHTLLKDLPSSTGEHVALTASRNGDATAELLVAEDPLAERNQIATLVEQAIAAGTKPHEIAIIALRNATADQFALHLRARGVPVLRAGDIDLDSRPSIRFLFALMRAVAEPSDVSALREALLAPWWDIGLAERSVFLRRYRDFELSDALMTTFPTVGKSIQALRERARTGAPVQVLSRILSDSGARDYFLANAEAFLDVPLLRQLVMHVEGVAAQNPSITFSELMQILDKAREHGLGGVKTSVTSREGYVTVITAHKAKGMEFEKVFVVGLTAREWEKGGKPGLIPSPLAAPRELQDLVKLLYVALTRAKDALVLSYAAATGEGRETPPTTLLPQGLSPLSVPSEPLPLLHENPDIPALICDLTISYLEEDGLSPSALNEYLDSPACFFARRILRLSEPEGPAITIGNAVHAGIAAYWKDTTLSEKDRKAAALAELERSLSRSLLPRNSAFKDIEQTSRASLNAYFDEKTDREPVAIEKAFTATKTIVGKKVLLKGKIDAVFKGNGGECLVDWKTSTTISKEDKENFERQIAFYDLLLRANDHAPESAFIIQVGEDGVAEHQVALGDDTRAALKDTLDAVLTELISGKWRKGEKSDYDALLELFA